MIIRNVMAISQRIVIRFSVSAVRNLTSLENYLSRLFQTDTFVLLNFKNFSSKIQNEFGLDIAVFRANNTENDHS